jgi:hypothetical protein
MARPPTRLCANVWWVEMGGFSYELSGGLVAKSDMGPGLLPAEFKKRSVALVSACAPWPGSCQLGILRGYN